MQLLFKRANELFYIVMKSITNTQVNVAHSGGKPLHIIIVHVNIINYSAELLYYKLM